MSIERWNADDQYLIDYVCNHEMLKGISWKKKHTIFNNVCLRIKRPERSQNALASYWMRWKKDDGGNIVLADEARMKIVRNTAFSLRLYNSLFVSRKDLLTRLAGNRSPKIYANWPYQREETQEALLWTSKQIWSLRRRGPVTKSQLPLVRLIWSYWIIVLMLALTTVVRWRNGVIR